MTTKKVNWDQVHFRNYELAAFHTTQWVWKARDLLFSAKKIEVEIIRLWESFRARSNDKNSEVLQDHYQGTYFMLIAYAIENLFKSVIIREDSQRYIDQFRTSRKFPKDLQSHDLFSLSKMAGFDCSLEEEDLLRRLTRSATWYGRYPVPLKYTENSGAKSFSNGKEYSVSWFGGTDVERINQLIGVIIQRLDIQGILYPDKM